MKTDFYMPCYSCKDQGLNEWPWPYRLTSIGMSLTLHVTTLPCSFYNESFPSQIFLQDKVCD